MSESEVADDIEMLNIYEVEIEGRIRHLICFIDPRQASAEGIAPRKIIGEFRPDPQGEFDPDTFTANPEFIKAYSEFMNEEAQRIPELMLLAQERPGETLNLVDPRDPSEEPSAPNVVGRFKIDPDGWIEHQSFRYNTAHRWFDPRFGVSGVLANRDFYEWLNVPESQPAANSDPGAGES